VKPVDQTVRGKYGNCFAACMASIFELSIEDVPQPDPNNRASFWSTWRKWLAERNLYAAHIYCTDEHPLTGVRGYYIAGIEWDDREDGHAVVGKDWAIVHDPCPEKRITSENLQGGRIEYLTVFTVIDPTKGITCSK
jgi:hypothetical protein